MKYVLVSFCNIPTITTSPLFLLQIPEEETKQISYAPVSLGCPEPATTATGLTCANGKIFILFALDGNRFHVAVLQEDNLFPLFYQEMPEVKDGHSILAVDQCLYIVSTGTDEVISYNIKEKSLENPNVIWRASKTRKDTHHINSIVEKNGEILVSAFGPKSGHLWSTASNGYIFNISSNSLIMDGIHHPHSLSVKNDKIFYSDSQRNAFCVQDQTTALFELDGYTRGVSWLSDDLVWLATSIGRRVSKSTGLVGNAADPGELAGECSLLLGDISERKIVKKIDLSWFGPEIYDVLVLETNQANLLLLSNASQLRERHAVQSLKTQLSKQDAQVQILTAQVQELTPQVQTLTAQIHEITNSRTWMLMRTLQNIRLRLIPSDNNLMYRLGKGFFSLVGHLVRMYENRGYLPLIRNSYYFDADWYRKQNPDITTRGDLARHYLLYGGYEGRDPGPNFSSRWYLQTYPDVQIAGTNPLVHYLLHGQREKRLRHSGDSLSPLFTKPPSQQLWGIMSTPHTLFVAHLIAEPLQKYGCQVEIITSLPENFDLDIYIVLAAQMFDRLPPPEKRIAFQLEQSVSSRWFTKKYMSILKESLFILEYSLDNIEFLAQHGLKYPQVYYLPIGSSRNMYQPVEKKFDILFYGDYKSSPRRQKMLNALSEHFNVKVVTEVFGSDMRELIRQSKLIVNLHYYQDALLELPRIHECLSLGVPVISESSHDQNNYPELAGAVRFFQEGSISEMIQAAKEILGNPPSPEDLRTLVEKSSRRFEFMFERFLLGIECIHPDNLSSNFFLQEMAEEVVLSLPETIERRRRFQQLGIKVGIFDGIRKSPGWVGCALSYAYLARNALNTGVTRLTVMEDDVVLPRDFENKLKVIYEYLDKQAGEWDIFSGLVADIHAETQVLKTEMFKGICFVTINKVTSMVFNIYNERALHLLSSWDTTNFDVYQNTIDRFLERQEDLRVIVTLPFLVGHDDMATSTLWNFSNRRYNKMINESQNVLKNKVQSYQTELVHKSEEKSIEK